MSVSDWLIVVVVVPLLVGFGGWQVYGGLVHGVVRRRMRRFPPSEEYDLGSTALLRGLFSIAVGIMALGGAFELVRLAVER